jgi:hypothetical protein
MDNQGEADVREALLLAGGAALVIFGAGLLMAHPTLRRTLLGSLTPLLPDQDRSGGRGGVLPDVERYLKLRAM